jgi:hypothetical protein
MCDIRMEIFEMCTGNAGRFSSQGVLLCLLQLAKCKQGQIVSTYHDHFEQAGLYMPIDIQYLLHMH